MNIKDTTLVSVCGDGKFLIDIVKAAQHCIKMATFTKIKILSNVKLNIDGIEFVKIPPLNKEKFSVFCMYELPKYIDTEYCLTFQGDGFIINPELWKDEFFNYDYIGAPWVHELKNQVGNGGFSLRSQKFLHCATKLKYNSAIQFQINIPAGELITPEDWFTCCYSYDEMTEMGVKFADIQTAYSFSVEHPSFMKNFDRFKLETYNSFGFHGSFNKAAMFLLQK